MIKIHSNQLVIMACSFIRNVKEISGGDKISFYSAFQTKWKLHYMLFSYLIVSFLFLKGIKNSKISHKFRISHVTKTFYLNAEFGQFGRKPFSLSQT